MRVPSADLSVFDQQLQAATGPALDFEQGFPSEVASAFDGKPPGKYAWGSVNLRQELQIVQKSLASLTNPVTAGPTLGYLRLSIDDYVAATQALTDAAHAVPGSTPAFGLIQQARRLTLLGGGLFDRGRAVEALVDGGQITVGAPIPDFATLGLGPAGSALAPSSPRQVAPKEFVSLANLAEAQMARGITTQDRRQLDNVIGALDVSTTNKCLTQMAQADAEAAALAGEAALDRSQPATPGGAALASQLDSVSVSTWNLSATTGGLRPLPSTLSTSAA